MSGDGGARGGGGFVPPDERTATQRAREPTFRSASPRRGRARWTSGPWRIVIAIVGVVAIGVGVASIVAGPRSPSARPGTGAGALGTAAFIHRADAICARLAPEVDDEYRIALADHYAGDDLGARRAVSKLEAAARALTTEVRALPPPAQDAGTVTTLLSEYERLIDDAIDDTPQSNAAASGLQARIAAQAAQFGFHVCGLT